MFKDHQVCCRANYDDKSINNEVDVAVIETFKCGQCDTKFTSLKQLKQHRHHCHPANLPIIDFFSDTCEVEAYNSAFEGNFRSLRIKPKIESITVDQIMAATIDALTHVLLHGSNLKAYVTIRVLMHKIDIS